MLQCFWSCKLAALNWLLLVTSNLLAAILSQLKRTAKRREAVDAAWAGVTEASISSCQAPSTTSSTSGTAATALLLRFSSFRSSNQLHSIFKIGVNGPSLSAKNSEAMATSCHKLQPFIIRWYSIPVAKISAMHRTVFFSLYIVPQLKVVVIAVSTRFQRPSFVPWLSLNRGKHARPPSMIHAKFIVHSLHYTGTSVTPVLTLNQIYAGPTQHYHWRLWNRIAIGTFAQLPKEWACELLSSFRPQWISHFPLS